MLIHDMIYPGNLVIDIKESKFPGYNHPIDSSLLHLNVLKLINILARTYKAFSASWTNKVTNTELLITFCFAFDVQILF